MNKEKIKTENFSGESNCDNNEKGYSVFYGDSEEIASALAISYVQNNAVQDQFVIERPQIHTKQIVYGLMLPVFIGLICIFFYIFNQQFPWWVFVGITILVFLFTVKQFVILMVLLYQCFAPEYIRASCVFEPTCSNYMLQAIDKYGFWIGFFKGIKRLFRCHPPNGGKDYP